MRWVPSGRASSELIAVRLRIRHHDDLGNALPLVRGGQVELLVEGEGHVHRGMRAPTTGIGLETNLLATKNSPDHWSVPASHNRQAGTSEKTHSAQRRRAGPQ